MRIPTNVLVISQGVFGCLPWGMILTFLNDYLSQNKGLSVQMATSVSGSLAAAGAPPSLAGRRCRPGRVRPPILLQVLLALGLGGAVGVIGGGVLGQWLYNRHSKWSMPLFIGALAGAGGAVCLAAMRPCFAWCHSCAEMARAPRAPRAPLLQAPPRSWARPPCGTSSTPTWRRTCRRPSWRRR